MSTKKILGSLGGFVLIIGVIVMGIMIRAGSSLQKKEMEHSYCIDNLNSSLDKDILYYDYIIEMLVEELKEKSGVADCKIRINYSNGDILSANISVVAGADENNISETDMLDYVSQALGIPTENIELSYD